jgi:predicted nucleic acid-binding protein
MNLPVAPGRIFLDTNVFIVGAAFPDSPESKILHWAGFGMGSPCPVEVVVSQELFEQILRVGRRLKGKDWGSEIVARIWRDMTCVFTLVAPYEREVMQDNAYIPREDIGIYLTARNGRAECFISANHELIRELARQTQDFSCLTPQAFVDRYQI